MAIKFKNLPTVYSISRPSGRVLFRDFVLIVLVREIEGERVKRFGLRLSATFFE